MVSIEKHHENEMSRKKMKDLFASDPERFKNSLCV
jgi:hypothetical protein